MNNIKQTYLIGVMFLFLFFTITETSLSFCPPPVTVSGDSIVLPDSLLPRKPSSVLSSEDSAFFSRYKYIRFVKDGEKPEVSDSDFYENAQRVIFVVAKTNIDPKQASIRELVDSIIPRMNRDSLQLDYMLIKGAASPEGPYKFNVWLGHNRSLNFFNYINSRLIYRADASRFNQSSVPEDYEGLVRMMRDANDPLTGQIDSLVRYYSLRGDYKMLKLTMQTMQKGKVWNYLLKTYFPNLRAAKVMFFFKKAEPKPVKINDKIYVRLEAPKPTLTTWTLSDSANIPQLHFVTPEEELPERLYRRHILAVRTNMLYDFFYMPGHYWAPSPNIQLEYYPMGGHITANLGLTCPYWHWWSKNQFWQIRDYVIEGRYYIKGEGQFIGPYVSAYVHTNIYGIGFSKTKGWEGEGLGAGVMGGYVMNISKNHRWRLEFSLGVGYYQTKYDPYVYGNPLINQEDGLYYYNYLGKKEDFQKRNHRYRWFGPTNIGIHLTYDLLFRRIQKKGVSFNRSEKVIKKTKKTESKYKVVKRPIHSTHRTVSIFNRRAKHE